MLESLIQGIDKWMQISDTNYGLYFVIIAIILLIGFAVSWFFNKKIGKSDERSDYIKLRIGYITLGIGWVLTLVFVSSLLEITVEHASQLVLIPLTLTVLAGAIVNVVYYDKYK